MATFIEVTSFQGVKLSMNVDNIETVWPMAACNSESFPTGSNCAILAVASESAVYVREHYHAVLALLGMAGCKVVR